MALALLLLSAASSPAVGQTAQQTKDGCRHGYRRYGELRDYALGRSWIVLANCEHPEMPRVAVETIRTIQTLQTFTALEDALEGRLREVPPVEATQPGREVSSSVPGSRLISALPALLADGVRDGSRVRLWRRNRLVSIELTGIALGGGAPGAVIRVRVVPGGRVLRGMVRAPGLVELEPAGGTGFSREGQ